MIVSSKPYPNLKTIFNKKSKDFDEKWKDFSFYKSGRDALLSGIIQLGLDKGDTIIIPGYICESAITPLRRYGYKLIFIDIDENANLPIDKIRLALKMHTPKALIVVHYFGLTFNIEKIIDMCHKFNVRVIEDCSHSFQSQLSGNIYHNSDMEIFSMRKSLPTEDGGVLRIKTASVENAQINNKIRSLGISSLKYLFIRFVEWSAVNCRINIYSPFFLKIKSIFYHPIQTSNVVNEVVTYKPSGLLKSYLSDENYLSLMKSRVQENYKFLSKNLKAKGFYIPFEILSFDSVPQVFLLYDNKGGLVDFLNNKGIGAYNWPKNEMPQEIKKNSEIYPNTIQFDQTLVLLPIHQGIKKKHTSYMVSILEEWISIDK